MAKTYKSLKEPPKNKNTSIFMGIAVSFLLFLAIPLTQIFTNYDKKTETINPLESAPLPPPPPIEEPPTPPKPKKEEPPPELDNPPPRLNLEQLEMALEPGTGDTLSGDFALPKLDVRKTDLGMNLFDINDLEKKPMPLRQVRPKYPFKAKLKGLEGFVLAEFIVDQNGDIESVEIKDSSDPVFEAPTIEAILNWKFTPGEKDGRTVRARVRIRVPFELKKF